MFPTRAPAMRRLLHAATFAPALLAAPASAATYSVIYSFDGAAGGAYPNQITAHQSDPNDPTTWALYGTTVGGGDTTGRYCGGDGGCGVVFKLAPPAAGATTWVATNLHLFAGGRDGVGSQAGVAFDAAGALYGTTPRGGTGTDGNTNGVVFRLAPPPAGSTSWAETFPRRFDGTTHDAAYPLAGLIVGGDGALFGASFLGGKFGEGTVYRLTPPPTGQGAWKHNVLYSFNGFSHGGGPMSPPIADASGTLYGTVASGGAGYQGRRLPARPAGARQNRVEGNPAAQLPRRRRQRPDRRPDRRRLRRALRHHRRRRRSRLRHRVPAHPAHRRREDLEGNGAV